MKLNSKSSVFGFVAALLLCALLVAPAAPGRAAEAKDAGLFINLTSLASGTAGHAMVFAGKVLERGHPVVLFLNHKAVLIATKDVPHASYRGKALPDHLAGLIEKGAKVIACQMCMDGHGITEADLLDGVERGKPELLQGYLFDPIYKTLSW